MGQENSLDHLIVRNFVGAGFDHNDLISGGRYRKIQIGYLALFTVGVDDQLTVDQTDSDRSDGAVKGNIGNRYGNGRTQHSQLLRLAILVDT